MNNRLIVSGCSFTDYCWSTWGDYLSTEFAQFENVGICGADNATIARRVVDRAQANDIVVILWSGFDRWSQYKNKPFPSLVDTRDNQWHHIGSVKSDKAYLVNHYHCVERFQTTMDYIYLIECDSRKKNYTAYHFSAFPFLLGEIEKTIDPKIQAIYNKYTISNDYLNEISLFDYQVQNNQCYITNHQYNPSDTHPTPLTHWEYCSKIIAPKLNLTLSTNIDDVLKEQHNLIVNNLARKFIIK